MIYVIYVIYPPLSNFRYHRRTGEMHPPKYKKQLYDKMIADRASAAARDSEIGRD